MKKLNLILLLTTIVLMTSCEKYDCQAENQKLQTLLEEKDMLEQMFIDEHLSVEEAQQKLDWNATQIYYQKKDIEKNCK